MNNKQTLLQIWNTYSRPIYSYLICEDEDGRKVYIEGLRPEDPEGGCMATGTPAALYGSTPDGHHWWHYPNFKESDKDEWEFIAGYTERFYVQEIETGKVYRGIETLNNGGYKVLMRDYDGSLRKPQVSHKLYEKIPDSEICQCCKKKLEPDLKTGLFMRLLGAK